MAAWSEAALTPDGQPAQRALRAGPLTLLMDGADLRYVRLGDQEVLRRVYVAVRDRNWGTVPPVLSNLHLTAGAGTFDAHFDVEHRDGAIDFIWHGTVSGAVDGAISYVMDGEARSTLWKNRIGICVLHPMDCAGVPCTVEKTDGAVEHSRFPQAIAPHQPFRELRAISYEIAPGIAAEVRLEGDGFEMEDQRNWTDASFKTYSTPLELPCPVEVPRGARIRQSFTLSLRGNVPPQPGRPSAESVTFDLVAVRPLPLPRLGLGVASHGGPLSDLEITRLRALRLDHLRLDLDFAAAGWRDTLTQAAGEARALDTRLVVALALSANATAELAALAEFTRVQTPDVATWLIFEQSQQVTTARVLEQARAALAGLAPQARIGGGTNAYFTELNRGRPPAAALDVVAYAISPQVHAFDNLSLIETLAAQAVTLESARLFASGKPLLVSPITLKPRFNPNATSPEAASAGRLPSAVDPRQMALFGAGWTAGSIKYLAQGGADGVTYYETTGWRGVMETAQGSPLPDSFPSRPGMLFPLYHVLADVGEFADGAAFDGTSSDPLRVEGLALLEGRRRRLLLANLTERPCSVRLRGLDADHVRQRSLDGHGYERATADGDTFRAEPGSPLPVVDGELDIDLLPYAVARLDWTRPA